MRKLCSLRTKIISAMVGLTLLTAIIVGGISVIKSSIVVSDSAKEMLLISSKNKSNELYNDIKQIEKSVNLIGSFVSSTSSMQSLDDMNKLKDRKFGETEYSKIRIYPKELGKNTKWAKSAYFYFNQNYIPSYDGAWYVENNGNFIREFSNSEITPEDGDWYFKPVEEKKGIWAEPYEDPDLKLSMITYSTPVYKNGFLLGLAGMDITLDELNTQLKKIDIYKGTDALIIDSKFNFVAGDKFKIGDNILNTKNGLYKFLKVSLDKQKSGFVEYKDNRINKIMTFSTLPNGFILLLDVPIAEVLSEMNNIIYLLTFVAFTVIFIASFIAFGIGNKLSKPIEELSKLSQKLANSDLTVDIKTDNSCEEMRSLSLSFNEFTQHLKDLIKQIAHSASDVSNGTDDMSKASEHTALVAQQVSNIANQLAEGSQEESDSINNCLNNVNSMFVSINKISDNTQVVVKLANESENNAESGFDLAEKAIDKIKIIKANTIETSQATNKLNTLASEIGIIVDLIKNIANQTNLLALNAAIEAARAGEQGKGFAVVADEVKKLAAQSANATNKITDMIKQIQDESQNVSSAMINSTNMVEEGVLMVENVGTNLEEILNATKEVSNNAKEVFKLVNDAASNSESVIKTMENISVIVEQSTASTQQVADSTQEQTASLEEINASSQALAQTAEDLKRLISVFKI